MARELAIAQSLAAQSTLLRALRNEQLLRSFVLLGSFVLYYKYTSKHFMLFAVISYLYYWKLKVVATKEAFYIENGFAMVVTVLSVAINQEHGDCTAYSTSYCRYRYANHKQINR